MNKRINNNFDEMFDDEEYYDDSQADDYEYSEDDMNNINIDELYEEIKLELTEEFTEMLQNYMSEYTKKMKSYIEKTISGNNTEIENYINDVIKSLDVEDYDDDDEEDYDDLEIDEEIKNKYSKMVTHKKGSNTEIKNKLQESMSNMFNNSEEWETFPATSMDAQGFGAAVKGNLNTVKPNVNLRSFLPPDEGRLNDPELGTHHRDSILDVAGAVPDDIQKALSKDYSKMFKK
jgi:hypothetical protein